MANKILLKHKGDVDDYYEPSDSENEYTEHEKKLLQKARKGRQRNVDAEQELLAFNQQDDSDDEDGEFIIILSKRYVLIDWKFSF